MDEPFSGLDPIQVENVIKLIFEVAALAEHNTIVVVTHDVASAVVVADTIWLMGRERDAEGKVIPGARLIDEVDLAPLGLAWWHHPTFATPGVAATTEKLRARFAEL
jgi:polar amino acid transport system ATP-binding protein/sulfate transport system ATP-binding protein